mmetsp:Transcript_18967/g.43390  ORF Transcript_18967/g.43390 Transcript_18967/m.43390 type:complete len:378 (-) Transcript_18967:187-1320(-)
MATEDEGCSSSGILLKQTLMSHNECFVYKVPPLAVASGYRANDWNLAAPLATCGFQVERRNNDLYLLFTKENHTKLFALSKIEGEGSQGVSYINVETVLDSSRYFVCKIVQSSIDDNSTNARTALLGFGFREREIAIDLLGNLQQFQQSIHRELEAKELASKTKSIPTLGKNEKMHIKIPGKGNGTSRKLSSKPPTPSGASGGGRLLLKKPPPGADMADGPPSPSLHGFSPVSENKRFSMSLMECPLMTKTLSINPSGKGGVDASETDKNADDDSECALAGNNTVTDDFLSEDDDDAGDDNADDDNTLGGGAAATDDHSEDAVGGASTQIGEDDDSFQFSDLNLDDLDGDVDAEDKDTAANAPTTANDDDFGDFQGA